MGHGPRPGRSPYGERGLKSRCDHIRREHESRSPYGERGLKFQDPAAGQEGQAGVALLTESVD